MSDARIGSRDAPVATHPLHEATARALATRRYGGLAAIAARRVTAPTVLDISAPLRAIGRGSELVVTVTFVPASREFIAAAAEGGVVREVFAGRAFPSPARRPTRRSKASPRFPARPGRPEAPATAGPVQPTSRTSTSRRRSHDWVSWPAHRRRRALLTPPGGRPISRRRKRAPGLSRSSASSRAGQRNRHLDHAIARLCLDRLGIDSGRQGDRPRDGAEATLTADIEAAIGVVAVLLVLAGHRQDAVLDFDLNLVGREPRKVARTTSVSSRRFTSIDGRNAPCGVATRLVEHPTQSAAQISDLSEWVPAGQCSGHQSRSLG